MWNPFAHFKWTEKKKAAVAIVGTVAGLGVTIYFARRQAAANAAAAAAAAQAQQQQEAQLLASIPSASFSGGGGGGGGGVSYGGSVAPGTLPNPQPGTGTSGAGFQSVFSQTRTGGAVPGSPPYASTTAPASSATTGKAYQAAVRWQFQASHTAPKPFTHPAAPALRPAPTT